MQRIIATVIMLALICLGTTPIAAQGVSMTVQFQVSATNACPNATYWAVLGLPASEFYTVQLADSDGDGVYSGSTQLQENTPYFVSLVQGTGTTELVTGQFPGQPSVTLRDFGQITPVAGQVFEARGASCPAGLPDTGREDSLPLAAFVSSMLLMTAGLYLRRRIWRHT